MTNADAMQCPYGRIREIETTADTSLDIRAESMADLFAAASWGMTALMIDPDVLGDSIQHFIQIQSESTDTLLIDWLSELLFLFDTRHVLFHRFHLTLTDTALKGQICGDRINPEIHGIRNAVKAVTWHGLAIRKTGDEFGVRILFDL